MTGEKDLTPRQERLVEAVVEGKADSKAELARIAGYAADNPTLASVSAIQALSSTKVQQAIQSRRESLAERAGIDPVTVLQRIETRANSAEVPHTVRQRADETLLDVLNLKDQAAGAVDARSLTVNASSEDVRDLLKLILGDSA